MFINANTEHEPDYNGNSFPLRIMYGRAYFLIQLFMFYTYGQHILLHQVELLTFNQDVKNKEVETIEIKNTQMVTVSATHYDLLNKRNDVIVPLANNSNIEKQISKLIGEFQNDNCLIIPYEKSALDWILALTNVKTIIYPKSHMLLMEKLRQFDTYIAIIRTIQDLKHFLTMLRGTPNWTYKAKYLLIFLGRREVMEEIFKITWKYQLLDVSVVIQHRESFEVYTHFPYRNGSCGSNSIPVRVDGNSDIFPEKIDSDLKGCEIRMMAVKIPPYVLDVDQPKDDPTKVGLEVTILHNVLKKMNFTEIYVPTPYPSWGKMLSETNFTMAFKFLYAREVDIVFGMIITNASFLRVFESTVCHIRGNTVWAVPTASEIAQWKNLSVIFDGIVWASIFFVFLLNGFAWWIIGRNREASSSYNELSLCLMGALYILLQGSFTTAKAWKLRLIVLLWSIASLLIYTAHQCQLTGILTSPLYDHQISSLKELVESDLHYGIHSELEVLYSDPNNPVHREILNNHEECSLQMECLNRTAFKRDFATIKNERQIKYLMPISYTTPRGKPMLYMFHENAVLYLCKYLMSEGFPFLKPMDRLIMLLQDSGLVAKWENDLAPKSTVHDDTELEPLTLNHLQAAFFLLLFGYIVASGIFLAEKCYERFGHKEKRVNVKDIPVLLGMSVEVHGRPVERTRRSAEDIIAGVDFLSVFIKSANDRSARNNSNKITTTPSTETTQASTDINESTTFINVDDNPTTIQNIDQQTETNKPVTIESSTDKSTTETIPVTLVSFETNTEIHETIKVRRGKNEGAEELKVESSKVILSVENPSAIVSEARKSDFSIEESEPIVLDTNHSPNDGVKFKTKPEDLVAIGANPDYIAQQNARIQGITNYNQPYGNRNPSSRGRSVSYSAVVQVLPHPHAAKSWKQEDESIRSTNRQRGNTPVSTSKDYDTNSDVDYDYTESYQDYNEKQNETKTQPISTNSRPGDAVAESKDFYVTRKYNPGDFNESGDKPSRNGKQEASNEKKHVEPTERNWGIPEKNYEIPESNHHTSPTVYARPEENYEIDETISVMTNGRAHGVQAKLDDKPLQIKVGQTPVKPDDNQKIGYVVEGRNYRKYRVEERTSDGFIVGEYGVVSNNDGSLRGVRYTADGTTNPRLIYDALMKFLSL